jgi:hypothetical protein
MKLRNVLNADLSAYKREKSVDGEKNYFMNL